MEQVRPFRVTLEVQEEHEYLVDARTSEEAEDIAERYFNEGEEGNTSVVSVNVAESHPVDEGAMGEVIDGEYVD